MNLILNDNNLHLKFAPLTLTRPLGDVRMGLFTNAERWNKWLPEANISFQTETYLSTKFPAVQDADAIQLNAAVIPNEEIAAAVVTLENDSTLVLGDEWVARRGTGKETVKFIGQEPIILKQRWDLFTLNDQVLVADYFLATGGRESQPLSRSNTVIGNPDLIFLEEGAVVEAAVLNTQSGPIYIGKDAEVMEGTLIRGPLALCEHAAIKMGAKIYGATTIGPYCKVGGEVSNTLFQAYSNKGHDGFLGNSLVGEWCNFGADTNTSNLKNNYSPVRTYSYEIQDEVETGEQFMGICMGDHSKCGINTMFNTATVVGVSCNIYGGGFPEKYLPSFSWGGAESIVPFKLDKAIDAANQMMGRRGLKMEAGDIAIFEALNKR